MRFLSSHIRGLMLVSGALTCTVLYAALFPAAALQSTFGEAVGGPAAEMVVRNWGVLIFLMGALLVRGAFDPAVRNVVLLAAGASKAVFIGLVLTGGPQFLSNGAAVPVVVDGLTVALFAAYLVSERRGILRA